MKDRGHRGCWPACTALRKDVGHDVLLRSCMTAGLGVCPRAVLTCRSRDRHIWAGWGVLPMQTLGTRWLGAP